MSGRSPMLTQKRPRPPSSASSTPSLPEPERLIYGLIKPRENMGILIADIRKETNLPSAIVRKALKSLQSKNLVKDVVNVHNKIQKIYMAVEFEPSREITGGTWYSDGNLNMDFISDVRNKCLAQITKLRVTTIEGIWKGIQRSEGSKMEISLQQIVEIVQALVLDKEVDEVKSSGVGEFAAVPVGKICYKKSERAASNVGALAMLPCGVCPRISECTPDGVISPKTCVYYNKWLQLEF
ncbi:uncharacterized protein [Typha latifolia]|uniref:uncharacterized protein n=1 Tax=Typha latifolia TaxID=4733 RepID=UPI003C2DF9AD